MSPLVRSVKKDEGMAKPKRRKISTNFLPISGKLSEKLYEKFTSVRFRVGRRIFEINLGEELILKDDIHTEVERLPAIIGYFHSIVASIENEFKTKDDLKKVVEARIDKVLRERGVTGEARIDKAIKRDPRWLDACLEVGRAKENLEKAKGLLFALRKKSESLYSRSADFRADPNDRIMGFDRDSIVDIKEMKF